VVKLEEVMGAETELAPEVINVEVRGRLEAVKVEVNFGPEYELV